MSRELDVVTLSGAEYDAILDDAMRYRWLRMQDWYSGALCVLRNPKGVLTKTGHTLGADCPSRERLDAAIDEYMDLTPNANSTP